MKEKIICWLNNGTPAKEGVQLMQEAGAPSLAMRLIRASPEDNRRVMASCLCRKYRIVCTSPEVQNSPHNSKPLSFREEFSFLNEPGCPVELEALASRKFSRYHAYVDLHKKLTACTSLEECARTARELINNYLENRMIWEELNYYQIHRSILGKHPIFAAYHRRKELLALPVKELIKRQRRLLGNIWRVQSELKKEDKPHLELERRTRLTEYQAELAEVNRLLDEE